MEREINNDDGISGDVERPALPLAHGIGRVLASHAEDGGKLGLREAEGFAGGFEIGRSHFGLTPSLPMDDPTRATID